MRPLTLAVLLTIGFVTVGCRTTDSDLSADTINQHIYEVSPLAAESVSQREKNSKSLEKVKAAFLSHLPAINARIGKTGYAEDLASAECSMGRQLNNYFNTTGPFELRSDAELQKIYEDEQKQATQVPSRRIKITAVEFANSPNGDVVMSVGTAAYIPGTEDFGSPVNGGQGYGEPVKLDNLLGAADQKLSATAGFEAFWAYLCSGFNKSIREFGWVKAGDQSPVPLSERPLVY